MTIMIQIMTMMMGRQQQQEPLMGLNIPSGLGTLRDTPGRVGGATRLPPDWSDPSKKPKKKQTKQTTN